MQAEFTPGNRALNLRSPLSGWMGGKWLLSKKIVPLLPAHAIYVEPFLGAGWVLIRKPKTRMEIANDINGDLINCWKVIRDAPSEISQRLAGALFSRQLFNEYRDMTAEEISGLTPAENAWRLLYLLKCSFGGRDVLNVTRDETGNSARRPSFGVILKVGENASRHSRLALLSHYLQPAHERIREVVFERLAWQKLLKRYDRASACFYLDPPYMGCENYYGSRFASSEFEEMKELLKGLRGKFLLSLNDCEEARGLFSGFNLYRADVLYTLNKTGSKHVSELFITNYELDRTICARHEIARVD